MRIAAAIVIILVFVGIFMANRLVENQKLSADELDNVRKACVTCHSRVPVYGQAPRVHEIHAALNCSRCHGENKAAQPSDGHAPGSSPSQSPNEGPPDILHSLVGHQDCLSCHGTSGGYAKQIPGDHVGRTNETCTECHTVSK
jgi:hypothetical protein